MGRGRKRANAAFIKRTCTSSAFFARSSACLASASTVSVAMAAPNRRKKTTGLHMRIAAYSQCNVNARLPKVFTEV